MAQQQKQQRKQQRQQQQLRPQPRRPARRTALPLLAAALATLGACSLLWARPEARHSDSQGALPVAGDLAFLGGPANKAVHNTVVKHFPGVTKGETVVKKALAAAEKYGLSRNNVIYGQSICPDEVNSDPGHVSTLLTKYYGRSFPLGGLGGTPFVGKTGFMAFSHHVPEDGHVLIMFGPHLGFSPDGEAGKFLRKGQTAVSTACGAISAAYAQVTSGARFPLDSQDTQQCWLREKLKDAIVLASKSDNPMVEVVKSAYKIIEKELLDIVNTDFGPGNLVLLGGIAVNMPYPMPGYFLPMHFSVRSKTMKPTSLMSAFD